MNITFNRPSIEGKTNEEALAILDRWVADTSDKLNYIVEQVNKDKEKNDGEYGNR